MRGVAPNLYALVAVTNGLSLANVEVVVGKMGPMRERLLVLERWMTLKQSNGEER